MICSRPIAVILLSSTALVFVGGYAAAPGGCPFDEKGDTTVAELKVCSDGYALFQRMAPPTPTNWAAEDEPVYDPTHSQRWVFVRYFRLGQAEMDARRAVATRKMQALMAKGEARDKANAAKLADIERRQAGLAKQIDTAVAQNNYAALAALTTETEKLTAEHVALSTDSSLDAEQKAIGAELDRDSFATYELIYGATDTSMISDFKPMASAVGRAYRREYEDQSGNPHADLVVVLPLAPGTSRYTIVQTSGDPARAQALLNGTKLR